MPSDKYFRSDIFRYLQYENPLMLVKRLRSTSLAFQLIISILTATVLLISGILIFNYSFSRKILHESARETAKQLSGATMNRMESVLISAQRLSEGMVVFLDQPEIQEATIDEMMKFALKNRPEIFGSAIAFEPFAFDPQKEAFAPYCFRKEDAFECINLNEDGYMYFDQDWYSGAKKAGKEIWTEPYFDTGGGNTLMTTFSRPFFKEENGDKVFRGVATADLSLDWLEYMMNSIKVLETGYVILISKEGSVITHPIKDFQMKNLKVLADDALKLNFTAIDLKMLEQEEGYFPFNSLVDGRRSWMYYSTVPYTGWRMGVVFPEEELFAGLHQLFTYTVFLGILGIILLSIVVILFSSQITKPLRRLTATAGRIGSGNFDEEVEESGSAREITLLGSALSRMQSELRDYVRDLEMTTKAKERFESELNIAHDIQQGMIPKIFPPFPDREDVDIYALLQPARQVGGDLYDFFFLDEETLCFAIGDVSDKGVPASLMMAITITLFRSEAIGKSSVDEIIRAINKDICKGNENLMFITFFAGILNVKSGELIYCNAGHNYPFLLRKDGGIKTFDETHGVPLGIDPGQDYGTGKIILERNEMLVLYSDGITEAMNTAGELYGEERFVKLLKSDCMDKTTRQTAEIVMNDVDNFARTPERSDDITLLILQYYPPNNK